jgi:3'-phosphoadenosine 5'-phosphosulfate sulfotransferase (PAPS reductase)/FAD synthetase
LIKVVVPVSGGKDSQACLKLASQNYRPEEIRALFCDTQFEHPLTYAHVEKLRNLYGPIQIDRVCSGSVEEQVLKHGRFPGGGARFCTEELKIWPSKRYYWALALTQKAGFEVWYGMRFEESAERKQRYAGKICDELYAPHEVMEKYPKYLQRMGVMFRLSVLHYSEKDIFDFIYPDWNPLYDEDFDRIGCFPCLASGDKPKEKAFQHDDFGRQQFKKVIKISSEIKKQIFTSKGGQARNSGCAFCEY